VAPNDRTNVASNFFCAIQCIVMRSSSDVTISGALGKSVIDYKIGGAGKTTGASAILPKPFPANAFINADQIANALGTDSPLVAGRVMLRQMHDARDRRDTFAFETTLAARSYVRLLTEAQQAAYVVHIAFDWLRTVELAKNRVAVRVQRGGHDIPAADIERRYRRGLRNFFELYQPLAGA